MLHNSRERIRCSSEADLIINVYFSICPFPSRFIFLILSLSLSLSHAHTHIQRHTLFVSLPLTLCSIFVCLSFLWWGSLSTALENGKSLNVALTYSMRNPRIRRTNFVSFYFVRITTVWKLPW